MRRPFRKTALASILFAGAVLAVAITVDAQQPEKTRWIGYLTGSGSLPNQAFVQGLRDLGWVEGKNIAIEYRPHAGRNDLLPGLAAELVQLNADVILAPGTFAALTAKQLIKTTPIVMLSSDPVGSGIVASRGNVTGLSNVQVELGGKRLEILKEAFPKVSRVAVLLRSGGPGSEQQMKEIEIAARSLHIQVQPTGVEGPSGFERAFSTLKWERATGLIVAPHPFFNIHKARIVELAANDTASGTADFSEEERQQLKLALSTFQVRLMEKFNPTQEQLHAVSEKVDYLKAAVDRLNKFGWKGVAVSTLFGIATTLSLDTERGRQLYGLFQQALSSLLHLIR